MTNFGCFQKDADFSETAEVDVAAEKTYDINRDIVEDSLWKRLDLILLHRRNHVCRYFVTDSKK